MIQTYIINQPRPWKVFFDSFGHLHLHAASMVCVSEQALNLNKNKSRRFGTVINGDWIDFHTYPLDDIGSVYTEAETSMNYRFLDLREGESISILSEKLQDILDEINSESSMDISAMELVKDLEKCEIKIVHNFEYQTLSYWLAGYEMEERDTHGQIVRSATYQFHTSKFSIKKYYESKIKTFLEIKNKYYQYLTEELGLYMKFAPHLKLLFDECHSDERLSSMISSVKTIVDSYNDKDIG